MELRKAKGEIASSLFTIQCKIIPSEFYNIQKFVEPFLTSNSAFFTVRHIGILLQ